jgi:hypothetical protein
MQILNNFLLGTNRAFCIIKGNRGFTMRRFNTSSYIWLVLLILLAGPSVAATMQANYDLNNGQAVTIEYGGTKSTYGLEFSPILLDFNKDGAYDLTTIAYCVDLDQSVSSGDVYDVELITVTGNYLAAAWIMDNYSGSGNATQNAAVQIAIWETVYDGIGGSLEDGVFAFKSVSNASDIYTLAQQYISELSTASLVGLDGYLIALSDEKQDLMVSAVPLPATAWLFISGLIGLIGLRGRKLRV